MIREPRDAIASLMARFDMDYPAAAGFVASSSRALVPLLSRKDLLILRYEDGFTQTPATIDLIAQYLLIPLEGVERDAIFAGLTPEMVSASISRMQERGAFDGLSRVAAFDPDTNWHPAHVGDLRLGKWQEHLTRSQGAAACYATRRYRNAFGYGENFPVHSGTMLDFGTGGSGACYLCGGFSALESWGVWATAETAEIRLNLAAPIKRHFRLSASCRVGPSFCAPQPDTRVSVSINGSVVVDMMPPYDTSSALLLGLGVEGDPVVNCDGITISFKHAGILSPAQLGIDADIRPIGIGIMKMRVEFE